MQINFHQVGGESIYLYYPVILLSISVALLFNPLKIFYFRTRMWLLYSLVSYAPYIDELATNISLVAPTPRRYLSCRVARFLHGRHVLLPYLQHGRKLRYTNPSLLKLTLN